MSLNAQTIIAAFEYPDDREVTEADLQDKTHGELVQMVLIERLGRLIDRRSAGRLPDRVAALTMTNAELEREVELERRAVGALRVRVRDLEAQLRRFGSVQ